MEGQILMEKIQYPIVIFVTEGNDNSACGVKFCTEFEHAICTVEHYDVRDGIYTVFDAEGRLLEYFVKENNKVDLRCIEDVPTHQEKLRHLLKYTLYHIYKDADFENLSIEQLIEKATPHYTYIPAVPFRITLKKWLKKLFGIEDTEKE